MGSVSNLAKAHAERLVYRVAGLPVALSAAWIGSPRPDGTEAPALRTAFASRFWHPDGGGEWADLIVASAAWPLALLAGSLWFTARNGPIVRQRAGKGLAAQVREQVRLYFSCGVLPPWYYIFSLHEDGCPKRARTFLQRFETKPCIFPLLKAPGGSPLSDKAEFARFCAAHAIPCVETIMQIDGEAPVKGLPDRDLFVKRSKGRGGRGAERWDRAAPLTFDGPDGERLDAEALMRRLVERSLKAPLIVQPRLVAHRELADLTTGALPTVRVVTCLDEQGRPEVIGAVFRMAVGDNVTVDNLHAGGIAAAVGIESGRLSRATNLGSDARLGWISAHPDTGAPIEGRALPLWPQVKQLAVKSHGAFNDRVVIGWDIAILDDGPILVEGNGNPDMDILQRFMRTGLRDHRFGELLAYHLRARAPAPFHRPNRSLNEG